MDKTEKKINSNIIYNGKIINLIVDDVICPTKNTSQREYITHPGGVAILAISDNKVLLEKQFRYPFNKEIFEIPAGKLEKNENHLVAAKRELKEETGYVAKSLIYLGAIYPTVGYSNEIIYIYLANDLTQGKQSLDEDEVIDFEWVDLIEFTRMIKEGVITDAKTICALQFYNLKGE